jgi:hypothetical protein
VAAQAHQVAAAEGIDASGYRIVFTTGPDPGQTSGARTRTRTSWAGVRRPGRPDERGE